MPSCEFNSLNCYINSCIFSILRNGLKLQRKKKQQTFNNILIFENVCMYYFIFSIVCLVFIYIYIDIDYFFAFIIKLA